MDVAEGGGDGESGADGCEAAPGFGDVFWLGVEAGFFDAGVIHAVFFATGDAEFDFEGESEFVHAEEVIGTCVEVLLEGFFGEVEHVGAVEWLAGLLDTGF